MLRSPARPVSLLLFVLSLLISVTPSTASAGSVLNRVKAHRMVHCTAVMRPGLASPGRDGHWQGLEVDVCRAIAAAVLGDPERITFRKLETLHEAQSLRQGKDDVFFLTGSEIRDFALAGKVLTGPPVFYQTHSVMVPDAAPEQHLDDLAGQTICFVDGSPVERSLHAYFDSRQKPWGNRGFAEDVEMIDAYNVQRCHGVAYEITTLATVRWDRGVNNLHSRILPEPVVAFPLMAASGTGDAQWASIIAWTVHSLVAAERPQTPWYAGGIDAMPVAAPELGLDKGWQARVIAAVGHYGTIFERNLGQGSPLKLARGLNANQTAGGLMLSPFLE